MRGYRISVLCVVSTAITRTVAPIEQKKITPWETCHTRIELMRHQDQKLGKAIRICHVLVPGWQWPKKAGVVHKRQEIRPTIPNMISGRISRNNHVSEYQPTCMIRMPFMSCVRIILLPKVFICQLISKATRPSLPKANQRKRKSPPMLLTSHMKLIPTQSLPRTNNLPPQFQITCNPQVFYVTKQRPMQTMRTL